MWKTLVLLAIFLSCQNRSEAQYEKRIDSSFNTEAYFTAVNKKSSHLQSKFEKQTTRYLKKLEREEKDILAKLSSVSSNASNLEEIIDSKYQNISDQITGKLPDLANGNYYIPLLDTIQTSFNFINQHAAVFGVLSSSPKYKEALASLTGLQGKINQSEEIIRIAGKRQEELFAELNKAGLASQIKKYSKTVQYYQSQVSEYKEMLNNPDKVFSKTLAILQKMPAFQSFFRKNSALASMFRLPDNEPVVPANLTGMQTRADVMSIVQQRIGVSADNSDFFKQKALAGQDRLGSLKSKANEISRNGSELSIPDYKIDNQKTKSFRRRLVTGMNFQNTRQNGILPVTTDLAVSVGYMISDKIEVGTGVSGKIGWGKDISHIVITWQGIGLRSYFEIKANRSFYVTGGAEMNYRSEIREYAQLKNYSAWQASALMGAGKSFSLGSKFFKTAKISLLWDALSYKQVPRSQAILVRFGYNF
jgi:hypothetical protein